MKSALEEDPATRGFAKILPTKFGMFLSCACTTTLFLTFQPWGGTEMLVLRAEEILSVTVTLTALFETLIIGRGISFWLGGPAFWITVL